MTSLPQSHDGGEEFPPICHPRVLRELQVNTEKLDKVITILEGPPGHPEKGIVIRLHDHERDFVRIEKDVRVLQSISSKSGDMDLRVHDLEKSSKSLAKWMTVIGIAVIGRAVAWVSGWFSTTTPPR